MHSTSPQTYRKHHASLSTEFFNRIIWVGSAIHKIPNHSVSSSSLFLLPLNAKCLSELPVHENTKPLFFLNAKTKFHTHIKQNINTKEFHFFSLLIFEIFFKFYSEKPRRIQLKKNNSSLNILAFVVVRFHLLKIKS
jgi:hypothetical protein